MKIIGNVIYPNITQWKNTQEKYTNFLAEIQAALNAQTTAFDDLLEDFEMFIAEEQQRVEKNNAQHDIEEHMMEGAHCAFL
jgi:hypothetical protein